MATAPESRRPSFRPGLWSQALGRTFSGRHLYVALAGLAAFGLCALLPETVAQPGAWVPAAGVALVLVAWLGIRAGLVIFAGTALTNLVRWLAGAYEPSQGALLLADPFLTTLEATIAWWLFHRVAHGARGLSDPRSAFLFLLVVPGLVVGVAAVLRALLAVSVGEDFVDQLVWIWLGRALGVMAVTPALLTAVTPGLLRAKAVRSELAVAREVAVRGHAGTDHSNRGDWIEIGGLAIGAGVLGLLLVLLASRQQLTGWQAWGGPLLLLLWASLRQGVRGGTVVASAAAALPLIMLPWLPNLVPTDLRLVQGNVLTQCGVALLVAAATTWVRLSEARYRRIVTHVPVVIYSVRVVEPPQGNRLPRGEITLVSAASDVLLGCTPEALLGDPGRWLDRVHPEDREILMAALGQLGRQVLPVTCEYRLAPRPDDPVDTTSNLLGVPNTPRLRARWVRDTMAPRFGPDNVLIGWEGVVTDITEQRALADDLRRTTSMFHSLVSNLPTGVFFVHGPTGQPILVNARARQLLGQREDASASLEHLSQVYRLYRSDGTLYPTDELPVCLALRAGATTMRDDIVVHRPDGRRIPLVTWAAPLSLSGHGRVDAAVWVMEDLTALHQAEAARRDTEGRLRTVVETMGEGLIVQDRNGIILDSNSAASLILGTPAERLRGSRIGQLGWNIVGEDGKAIDPEEMPARSVLRTGRPLRNTVLGLLPETAEEGVLPRWLLVNAMPLGSAPTGVVITFSDITVYRQTQEIVRASEERYRGLVESLPLLVTQCDRSLNMVYANPALRSLTGYEPEELTKAEVWQSRVVAEDLPELLAMLQGAVEGQIGRAEARFLAKDGSEKVAYFLSQPRRHGNAIVGITNLIVDMTRERRLEGDLQRAQRLELVGRLSSGIVHDFNNLLSVVLGLTDLARASLPMDHPTQPDLVRITEAGEQAADLARQLLTFSNNQRHSPSRRVDVTRVVRRTLDLMRATLPVSIQVKLDLSADELFVQGDETQLHQVVMNLCLNAREAMVDGGRLTVTAGSVLLPASMTVPGKSKRWVQLSVCDEGPGMSRQLLEKIFDPFFSTKERGTGLGLAVVKQIVQGFGGHIEVSSQPGQGACFEVWLPESASETHSLNLVPEPVVVSHQIQ